MKACHEEICQAGKVFDLLGAHRDDLTESGPRGKAVLDLAVGLAAETSDAVFHVLVKMISAHLVYPPNAKQPFPLLQNIP
jgi:hypothetical protein